MRYINNSIVYNVFCVWKLWTVYDSHAVVELLTCEFCTTSLFVFIILGLSMRIG